MCQMLLCGERVYCDKGHCAGSGLQPYGYGVPLGTWVVCVHGDGGEMQRTGFRKAQQGWDYARCAVVA